MVSLRFVLSRVCVFLYSLGPRSNRAGKDASRKHQLNLHTPLPAQKVILNVSYNKAQLIKLICQYLMDHEVSDTNRLVVTSENPIPNEIVNGRKFLRDDLRTTHEEADVIIVQQIVNLSQHGCRSIKVICDDTDVFVLLMYFNNEKCLSCIATMERPIAGGSVIDIGASAAQHKEIVKHLPAAHALTGCDTVSYIYGIGKVSALKVLKSGMTLNLLGQHDADMDDVVSEATSFIAACYGSRTKGDLSEIRYTIWASKMANTKITSAPKLKFHPPTNESFVEHVRRAHHKTAICKGSLSPDPPQIDPVQYGWSRGEDNSTLSHIMLPDNVSPVPVDVLRMIKCGC